MKVSKEHTDAESPAKGFVIVHQSSGKDFTLFILVVWLVKAEHFITSAIFRNGRNNIFNAKMKLRPALEGIERVH